VWETGEVHAGSWLGDLREKDHLEDLDVDETIILKWILKKWVKGEVNGLVHLSIGTGGGLLWKRWWNFGLYKMLWISWRAEDMVVSQESVYTMELVSWFFSAVKWGMKLGIFSKCSVLHPTDNHPFGAQIFFLVPPHIFTYPFSFSLSNTMNRVLRHAKQRFRFYFYVF